MSRISDQGEGLVEEIVAGMAAPSTVEGIVEGTVETERIAGGIAEGTADTGVDFERLVAEVEAVIPRWVHY